jgi:post-segregation antitoxin (ccd killing protein)
MIMSVSLSDKLYQYAQDHDISLSKLLQDTLLAKQLDKESRKLDITTETKLAILSDRFNKACRFIEEKGLTNDFLAK